jgi:histidinol dehydrogenase
LRAQQVIEYGPDALRATEKNLTIFSEAEDLPAHGAAVYRRFEGN